MGLCPKPCLGDFSLRSPLRTFKTFTARGGMSLFLRGTDFRCSRFPCYEFRLLRAKSRPAGFVRRLAASLRYRIEAGQVSDDWGGTTRRSFWFDWMLHIDCCHRFLHGAEIPPAGAPAGFDFAAIFDFIICFFCGSAAPLRMTK